jgi:hypothetical protein
MYDYIQYMKLRRLYGHFLGATEEYCFRSLFFHESPTPFAPSTFYLAAFYWRVQRDYADAPEPKILFFNPSKGSLDDVKQAIIAAGTDAAPRIVLQADRPFSPNAVEMNLLDKSNLRGTGGGELPQTVEKRTTQWAKDSVGVYESPFSVELKRYGEIHSVKTVREMPMANEVLQLMRNCKGIFTKHKGNRTCFQICD